ncbi:hypothetical protein FN846DRAFT_961534 [Sphaerosporella brunnea]|uniref:Uncharacterized protein n=1 Tax=Sphaerosporella brunnea TaxID=1250544 RepID=A0A5J5EQ12_9PEZI|nr:hypothetical protein FN846DRAFT_961534 [Sphaerosporella brunnea]
MQPLREKREATSSSRGEMVDVSCPKGNVFSSTITEAPDMCRRARRISRSKGIEDRPKESRLGLGDLFVQPEDEARVQRLEASLRYMPPEDKKDICRSPQDHQIVGVGQCCEILGSLWRRARTASFCPVKRRRSRDCEHAERLLLERGFRIHSIGIVGEELAIFEDQVGRKLELLMVVTGENFGAVQVPHTMLFGAGKKLYVYDDVMGFSTIRKADGRGPQDLANILSEGLTAMV